MNKLKKLGIIVICIIIIVSCACFKSVREGLTNSNNIVLIGDSVLNNSKYVPEGKSVVDILKSKTGNVYNFAKDGAMINDLYSQLEQIPVELNKEETYVFISVGGNDILKKAATRDISQLFNSYMDFISALRARLGSVKINILNLYLPANPRYKPYKKSIDEWNELIKENSTKMGEMYNVVDINVLLTKAEDFVYDIEPSELGSKKIANAIYYVS